VIDDGVASGAQFTNDIEFSGWFLMVYGRNMLCKPVRDETKSFAQEIPSPTMSPWERTSSMWEEREEWFLDEGGWGKSLE
jgi:hypothetical protein